MTSRPGRRFRGPNHRGGYHPLYSVMLRRSSTQVGEATFHSTQPCLSHDFSWRPVSSASAGVDVPWAWPNARVLNARKRRPHFPYIHTGSRRLRSAPLDVACCCHHHLSHRTPGEAGGRASIRHARSHFLHPVATGRLLAWYPCLAASSHQGPERLHSTPSGLSFFDLTPCSRAKCTSESFTAPSEPLQGGYAPLNLPSS